MNDELAVKLEEYLNDLSDRENETIIEGSTKYIIEILKKEKQLTL